MHRYLLALSTTQMSQQPNIGPFSGLLAIANWTRFKGNFSPILRLKTKLFEFLSGAQCFLVDAHGTGVYPPITLPNYVYTNNMVFVYPSHNLWNSLISKRCSEARNSNFRSSIFSSKSLLTEPMSLMILLLRGEGFNMVVWVKGEDFSFLIPGFRYISLIFSNWRRISSSRRMT